MEPNPIEDVESDQEIVRQPISKFLKNPDLFYKFYDKCREIFGDRPHIATDEDFIYFVKSEATLIGE